MAMRHVWIPAVLLATLAGCTKYYWNGQTFSSPSAAMSAQSAYLEDAVSRIQPIAEPVGGKLRMYYLNRDVGRELLLVGNKASANGDFVLDVTYADLRMLRKAIERRGIFDSVELAYGANEHREADPDAVVLYFYAPNQNTGQWYFRGHSVPRSPVSFDGGTADPVQRMTPFLDILEGYARAEAAARERQ